MDDFFGRGQAEALVGPSFTTGSIASAIRLFAMGGIADRTGHYFAAFLCSALINGLVVAIDP